MSDYALDLLRNGKENEFVNNYKKIFDACGIHILNQDLIVKAIIKNNLFFANLDLYRDKISDAIFVNFLRTLYYYDKKYVLDNILLLLSYYNSEVFYISFIDFLKKININILNILEYINDNNIRLEKNSLLKVLINHFHEKDLVISNIDIFIDHSSNLLELKKMLENLNVNKIELDKLNARIDNNYFLIKYEIINSLVDIKEIDKDKIIDFIDIIVKELKEFEKIDYHDISIIDKGAFSTAFKIGNKVLKIGKKREIFKQMNNKRFLQPLYRSEILGSSKKNFLFCIEITEYVDTSNITKEDVYMIYKELREKGLVWSDCKESNLGRLIKDNRVYFNDIDYVSKKATGYDCDNSEVLKKGDLVIVDTDFIYDEEEFFMNGYFPISDYVYEFEKRYKNELDEKQK